MKQSREWQRMLSGRRLDLFDPSPVDIEIEDIARGLAFVARWNGQTDGDYPYSVAQHSLLVEEIFNIFAPDGAAVWKLAALLHDAAEYVVGDMVSPVKGAVGPEYSELESRLMTAVHIRFGIPDQPPPRIGRLIKKADKTAARLEATQIALFTDAEANRYFGRPAKGIADRVAVRPKPPEAVRNEFEERTNALLKEMDWASSR